MLALYGKLDVNNCNLFQYIFSLLLTHIAANVSTNMKQNDKTRRE